MAKIYIDPGHNYSGADTGATGGGVKEQDISVQIGNQLKALLTQAGHTIKMSRENITDNTAHTDLNGSLADRYNGANNWGADLFVSIHCNAFNGTAHGTETYYCPGSVKGSQLAAAVQKQLIAEVGRYDRGVKSANYAVIKHTSMPAILVETAFIDNAADRLTLVNNQAKYALAIFKGIQDYLGNSYGEVTAANPTATQSEVFNLTKSEYLRICDIINAMGKEIVELKAENQALRSDTDLLITAQGGLMIYDYIDDNMPDWAREAVQAAVACGALKGDENGKLGLTTKDLRYHVIAYRNGHYRANIEG